MLTSRVAARWPACICKCYHKASGLRSRERLEKRGACGERGARTNESLVVGRRGGLFVVSAAGAQTPPLDREVKATPGREVRVGIYTSMRADCTAGPLPAIRLSVAPEHGAVTVRRATLTATNVKQCLAADQSWSRSIGLNRSPPTTIG